MKNRKKIIGSRNRKKRRDKIKRDIVEKNIFLKIKEYRQFKRLKEEILKDKECSKCGLCCKSYRIRLTQEDLDNEPQLIENSILLTEDIIKKYKLSCKKKHIRVIKTVSEENKRCIFYDENIGCKIHLTKPAECVEYVPSLSHCKSTELKDCFNLASYYNMQQKIFIKSVKNCSAEEKIERTRKLLEALIIPFIAKFYKKGDNIQAEPENEKLIPSFIKRCLDLDDSYKFIKDLPMVKSHNDKINTDGFED